MTCHSLVEKTLRWQTDGVLCLVTWLLLVHILVSKTQLLDQRSFNILKILA